MHSEYSEYREEIPHGDHPVSYDRSEPRARAIAIYMAVTVVFLVLIGVAVQNYYDLTYEKEEYSRVLSQPNWQLQDLHKKEQWELTHYGYIEKDKGKVRIPIEEAMQLVARDAAENRPQYPTAPSHVKTAAELAAAGSPGVSQPGAAAALAAQEQGQKSSPNVQLPAPREHK